MAFVLKVVEFVIHGQYPHFEWGFAHSIWESNQHCLVPDLFPDQ